MNPRLRPAAIGSAASAVGIAAAARYLSTSEKKPDHGRHLWDENTTNRPRPGYGLYDRALGIQYLLGVWDACRS